MSWAGLSVFAISIWQTGILRNWNFLLGFIENFIKFAQLLGLRFLWACGKRNRSDFPWSSGYPALNPAPAPVFFADTERSLAQILAWVCPPLHDTSIQNTALSSIRPERNLIYICEKYLNLTVWQGHCIILLLHKFDQILLTWRVYKMKLNTQRRSTHSWIEIRYLALYMIVGFFEADLMKICICHGSLTLDWGFFSLLYSANDFLHGLRPTAPLHLFVWK